MLDRVPTSRTAHAPWMAVLLLSALAPTSRAQTIEITPVAGYETHFSFSLGLGARARLTDSVGLRLESRWFATVLGNGDDQYSGPGAMGPGTSQLLSQLDLRAGLSLRF